MKEKIVALLTGRGNNTLNDKNVRDILGHPVLYYPANAASKCKLFDDYFCSSDDEKILAAAEESGFKRIVRPLEYALPTSQHIDCILHALRVMKEQNIEPDILVVILANNVTISSKQITDCIEIMRNDMSISAVVPVYEDNDHHPLRAKGLNPDGTLCMYEKGITGPVSTNRQDLPTCRFLAHNFWVLNVKSLLSGEGGQQPWDFMGYRIYPYEVEESIDIHHEEDLYTAARWIEKNYVD